MSDDLAQRITRDVRTQIALMEVERERNRQQEKWGTQRLDFPVWQTVLTEEVGEVAEAILRHREAVADPTLRPLLNTLLGDLRAEIVQVAAVAVSMIEHIDELQENAA